MERPLSVTFDTNLVEIVLDGEKSRQKGGPFPTIYSAIRDGRIKGYVARTYFSHDAISRGDRMEALSGDVEFVIPVADMNGSRMHWEQMAKIPCDKYHAETIMRMRELGIGCLDVRRRFWPEPDCEVPFCPLPEDYNEKTGRIRKFIEEELHCGFCVLRRYLQETSGVVGNDLAALLTLKESGYNKKQFNRAYAEAADGDTVAAHYGHGIDIFCTDDQAIDAGSTSIFSPANRRQLVDRFGVRIISSSGIEELLEDYD